MELKKHSLLPNEMGLDGLSPQDQLVYVCIRSYMDKNTFEAFPSLQTIAEKIGCSVPTVRSSINRLVQKQYIYLSKRGKKNIYKFNKLVKYEPFSDEFLNNNNISFGAKAYLTATQQYMFKDCDNVGKMSMSNYELAKRIDMSEGSIRKYNNELIRKNYLTIIKNEARDIESGCKTITKVFDLTKLGLAIIWVLKNHEERISDTESRIDRLERKNEELVKENKEQQKLIDALLRERGPKLQLDFII